MERLYTINSRQVQADQLSGIVSALENGQVIYLPQAPFYFAATESFLLSPDITAGKAKNISYDSTSGRLSNTCLTEEKLAALEQMMQRYIAYATGLIQELLPVYSDKITRGRTSFRPVEIKGRPSSYKKDDKRLHVDAFPATPMQGKRILRVFCNVNPSNQPRVWNLGEPFEQVAKQFLPTIKTPSAWRAKLLKRMKLTKSLRTPYDHYMLNIHDNMKYDLAYQAKADKVCMEFPANSTWITYTDITSHAALTGQYLLEQTFYLNPEEMQQPAQSPLYILERLLGKTLL